MENDTEEGDIGPAVEIIEGETVEAEDEEDLVEFADEEEDGNPLKQCRSKRGQTLICAVSPQTSLRPDSFVDATPANLTQEDIVIRYGLHSVQGQRPEMEDDHKCIHRGCAEPQTPSCQVRNDEDIALFGSEDDSYFPHPDASFFGIYDGHAGTAAASFLRCNLHRAILSHPKLLEDPELAAREGIAQVEASFMEYADSHRLDAGSTLAIVLIIGTELVAANVGDSEVVLNRNGHPMVLSTIHNMLKNSQEEDRVRDCGGRIHHKRLGHPRYNPQFFSIAVTRSIGDVFFKTGKFTEGKTSGLIADADTCKVTLTSDDRFVILGCDGLWDVMSYQQAIDFAEAALQEGKSCQAVSEELVNRALSMGSTDNITALIITLR